MTGHADCAEDRSSTFTTGDRAQAAQWAEGWRSQWSDVRVESRRVTTTRTTSAWEELR